MPELMTRDEVAALLGISPESVRSTLRRYGITEQRGYPRDQVESLRPVGQGTRTDLRFPDEPKPGTSIRMPNGRTFTRTDKHPSFRWSDGTGWYSWSEVQSRARREGGELVAP